MTGVSCCGSALLGAERRDRDRDLVRAAADDLDRERRARRRCRARSQQEQKSANSATREAIAVEDWLSSFFGSDLQVEVAKLLEQRRIRRQRQRRALRIARSTAASYAGTPLLRRSFTRRALRRPGSAPRRIRPAGLP